MPAERLIYDWDRFWVARTDQVDLSDAGFLADPTRPFAIHHGLRPRTLPELAGFRALALLGEPGVGKSSVLTAEAGRRAGHPSTDETVTINVDLRAFSSESLLYRKVFESAEFIAWLSGRGELVLNLDSLDEALLRIETVANLLASELPNLPFTRMSLRIACRTAVWPAAILEESFQNLWGKDAVGIFELAPLRRCDVIAAAAAQSIDPDVFIQELYAADAVPFAIKPLTLNLLLNLFRPDGRLPRSTRDLYMRGCMALCEESNPSRQAIHRTGTLNARQRLRVAGRVAAATVLANRYAVWTGPEANGIPEEDVAVSELCPGAENGDFPTIDVSEDHVREVLDTGLFSSRGPDRMGWAHLYYAEFLAAHYLVEKGVSAKNLLRIVQHPNGGLVPELAAVTSWVASLDTDVRHTLIETEPLVLLRGDLTGWPTEDLAALTASLLAAFEQPGVYDFVPGISGRYAKLRHPGLADQLRPYILDAGKNLASRRAAVTIAGACKVKELQPELLSLALNKAMDHTLRARAVSALGQLDAAAVASRLLPLAKGELGLDPQDDIRGNALELLWPAYITARELFSILVRPNDGYVGSYVMFLTHVLPDSLTSEQLPEALAWATSYITTAGHMNDFQRKSLADAIFMRAWKCPPNRPIVALLMDHILASMTQGRELFQGTNYDLRDTFRADLNTDATRRRALIVEAASRPLERLQAFYLQRPGILQSADLPWLLTLAPGSSTAMPDLNEDALLNLVEVLFHWDDAANFENFYEAAMKWPRLRERFSFIFDGVPLDSPDAQQQRRSLELSKEVAGQREPLVTPPPAERIAVLLEKFEAGDWLAWWQLNRELTLTPTSRMYGVDFNYSIVSMPGWQTADQLTKQRILNAAEHFLTVGKTSASEWIGTNRFNFVDAAAFRALILLRDAERSAYDRVSQESWAKWAPAIAALPSGDTTDKSDLESDVIADALAFASGEFVQTVRLMLQLERQRAANDKNSQPPVAGASFFILHRFQRCWNSEPLKEGVFAELQDPANSANQFVAILEPLLIAQFAPAREYASAMLEKHTDRPFALEAAVCLARHTIVAAWPAVWAYISATPEAGRDFFLKYASNYSFYDATFASLDEEQLAKLYVLMEGLFPRSENPEKFGGAHFVGPQESVAHIRDGLPGQITRRATQAAVQAMRSIIAQLPGRDWLTYELREAEQAMRAATWAPLTPAEVLRLTESSNRLLVRSAEDLSDLLVETLRKYESQLHGELTPIRDLWDRQADNSYRPIEEDNFSNHVERVLRQELTEIGIVANREVEVVRGFGPGTGRRTDIRIDALRRSTDGWAYDVITGVIETKGNWHSALFRALHDQLYIQYLVPLQAPVGIFLVGWFDKAKWDVTDARRRAAPDDLAATQTRLDAQAAAIPAGYLVRAIVVDCHAL